MNQDILNDLRRESLSSLYIFCKGILGFIDFSDSVHLPLCNFLQDPAVRFKGIVMPRGFYKTCTATIGYRMWKAINNPNLCLLSAMNSALNARKRQNLIRQHVQKNRLLGVLFPEIIPDFRKVRWNDECAELSRTESREHGTFECAGVETRIISGHWNDVVGDDIVTAEFDDMTQNLSFPTRDMIDKGIGWWKGTNSLAADQTTFTSLYIGTRWAAADPINHIKENEPDVVWYEIKALDKDGNPTFPEKFPLEVLERLKLRYGSTLFNMLYMNDPVTSADSPFKPEDVKIWDELPNDMTIAIALDPAISESKLADNSAFVVVGTPPNGGFYVCEVVAKRMSPLVAIETLFSLYEKWSARYPNKVKVGIESVAYQKALAVFTKERMRSKGLYFTIDELKEGVNVPKDTRIRRVSPIMESGALFIGPGQDQLRRELLEYPRSAHDDVVDALAHAISLLPSRQFVAPKAKVAYKDPFMIDNILDEVMARRGAVGSLYGFGRQTAF